VVLKLGSSIVADDAGELRSDVLARVCDGVAGLRRAGVDVTAEEDPGALPSLLVVPAGTPPVGAADDLTPVLTVHAGTADSDRDMDETLAGIAAGPGTV
jgi:hypothetical protein